MLRGPDRELLSPAIPALEALVAEPVFLMPDSAIVGRLGTAQLPGPGIASTVLLNAVFLCIFLAHGTTAPVARRAGAGDLRRAFTRRCRRRSSPLTARPWSVARSAPASRSERCSTSWTGS